MDFEIDGHQYRLQRMPLRKQVKIAKRLARFAADANTLDMKAIIKSISETPDDDVDYIMHTILDTVMRKDTGGTYAKIITGGVSDYDVMYDDLTLPKIGEILKIAAEKTFGNFFGGGGQSKP